jgi:Flp pilus assembly CpaE family ATPase
MPNKTVLLIDPDNASLNYLAQILQEQKFKTLQSGLGKEGLIFAWRDRPDLIILDPVLKDIDGRQFVEKIRQDERTSNTPILALSSDTNPAFKHMCLDAGCTEYLLKSGEVAAILPDVVARLTGLVRKVPIKADKEGDLIVFLSAKGGTGTSSLCANFAMTIGQSQPDASVVVADFVLPIGSIGQIVGYTDEFDLVSAAALPADKITGEFFKENLPAIPLWNFQLLPGAGDPERAMELQVSRVPEIITVLKKAFDYVFVDLGRSLSRISMPIILGADILVLTISTDQSTVSLTKKVLEYLQTQGIKGQTIYPIINRVVGLEGMTKSEAEEMLGLTVKVTIPFMGSNFVLANNQHQPVTLKYENDTTSFVFRETANDLLALVNKIHKE